MKLTVSVPTFNEIAGLLEKEGQKVNGQSLTLEKGTALVQPIDYRLVTIRRDCVIEATKIYNNYNDVSDECEFIKLVDAIYQYVLNEKKPPSPPMIVPEGYEMLENKVLANEYD